MTSVNDSLMYQGNCNVPTWDRDSGGNITGLVGPDGTEYEVINDISELIPEYTPSASASAGVKGTITRDASYLYVCTATNTWERVAIATW